MANNTEREDRELAMALQAAVNEEEENEADGDPSDDDDEEVDDAEVENNDGESNDNINSAEGGDQDQTDQMEE